MTVVEFIGFIISFLALVFLFFKNRLDTRYRKEHPEQFEDEELEDEPLQEIMKALERPIPPKPLSKPKQEPRRVAQQPSIKKPQQTPFSSIEKRQLRSEFETRKLESRVEARRIKSDIEDRRLTPTLRTIEGERKAAKEQRPRVVSHLQHLPSLKDMVIYYEIFNKPKGL